MVLIPKINAEFFISNPANVVKPNEVIEGNIVITNDGKKEKKLKRIELYILESYEQFIKGFHAKQKGSYGTYSINTDRWEHKQKTLTKYILAEKELLEANTIKKYPFTIKLPSTWAPKEDKRKNTFRDWHIALALYLNTKSIIKSVGSITSKAVGFTSSIKYLAYCVLPIEGSARPPSYSPSNISTQPLLKKYLEFCPECGKENSNSARYCGGCGIELAEMESEAQDSRYIPKEVIGTVWMRDGGKCVQCGSTVNLQLDHIIPYSKGGATTEQNLQLLCKKCNQEKSDKIG